MLQNTLLQPQPESDVNPSVAEPLQSLVCELYQLLKLQDLKASAHVDTLKDMIGKGSGRRTLIEMDKKIKKLEFGKALPLLSTLANELGVSLEDVT